MLVYFQTSCELDSRYDGLLHGYSGAYHMVYYLLIAEICIYLDDRWTSISFGLISVRISAYYLVEKTFLQFILPGVIHTKKKRRHARYDGPSVPSLSTTLWASSVFQWNQLWSSWAFLSNEQYYVLDNLVCEGVLRPASENPRYRLFNPNCHHFFLIGKLYRIFVKNQLSILLQKIIAKSQKVSRAEKKKKQQQRKESYSVYTCLVLKHVHPDFDVSSKTMYIANSLVNDVFEQVNSLKLWIILMCVQFRILLFVLKHGEKIQSAERLFLVSGSFLEQPNDTKNEQASEVGWYPIAYIFDLLGPVYIEVGFEIFLVLKMDMNVAEFLEINGFLRRSYRDTIRKYISCEFHLGSDLYDFFYQRHFNADATVGSMKDLGIIYTRNSALRTSDFNANFVYLLRVFFSFFIFHPHFKYFLFRRQY
uniref:Piezo_RRas_bdg domain-containing protein n=1 Tax=Heterorhabditis bacteriophora TaxID=37862 RepID=A0A1I7WGC2_HETBA